MLARVLPHAALSTNTDAAGPRCAAMLVAWRAYCSRDATAHRVPVPRRRSGQRHRARVRAPRRRPPPRPGRPGEHPASPSSTPSGSATATSRPTCTSPATACCWPSTTHVLDRVTDRRGPDRRPRRTPTCAGALIGGREPIPTMADLLEHFPRRRFNIDLKSDAAVPALADLRRAAPGRTTGSASARSPSARLRRFRRARRPAGRHVVRRRVGVALGRSAPRVLAERVLARRRRRAPGAAPPRAAHGRHRRASSSAPTPPGAPVHVWTVDEPPRCTTCSTSGSTG